ncbi:hypothetical protein ACNOYE_06215 [Nannocystaceae bacterium ST9]
MRDNRWNLGGASKSLVMAALLAFTALLPACDLFNPNPCDPETEVCPGPFVPTGLAPRK